MLMASYHETDCPPTPRTPDSPGDINLNSATGVSEPITFTDCQALARQVRFFSESLIEGSWVEGSDVRGKKKSFIPSNFDSPS